MSPISFAIFACISLSLTSVLHVNGHGRLVDPPSRSSLWRFTSNPLIAPHADRILRNFNDDSLDCGGAATVMENNGKCGVCGDPYNSRVKNNEAGGRYALGIISAQYQEGQVITVRVQMTIGHTGYYEFRLCPWNNPSTPITQECLDRYVLQQENGNTRWPLPSRNSGFYEVRLQLPAGVTCTQCVLQWKHTTNDFPRGGFQERNWMGCSDVAITARATTTAVPTTIKTTKYYATNEQAFVADNLTSVMENIDCSSSDVSSLCLDCSLSYMCILPNYPVFIRCPKGKACDRRRGGCFPADEVPECD